MTTEITDKMVDAALKGYMLWAKERDAELGRTAVRHILEAALAVFTPEPIQAPDGVLEISMARDHAGAEWSVEVADGRVAYLFGVATFQDAIDALSEPNGGAK